jgi:hypothetical protein
VFLVNSRQGNFRCAPNNRGGHLPKLRPAFLPSSLAANHSFPLGYSPYPPVSVSGTVPVSLCLEVFLGRLFALIGKIKILPFVDTRTLPFKASLRICLERSSWYQQRQTNKALELISFVTPSQETGGLEY